MKEAMDAIYNGAVVLVKDALPAMIEAKNGGRIVFVISVDSLEFPLGCSACSGSKSAILGLAESLRNELLLYNTYVALLYPSTSSYNILDSSKGLKTTTSSNQAAEEARCDTLEFTSNVSVVLKANEYVPLTKVRQPRTCESISLNADCTHAELCFSPGLKQITLVGNLPYVSGRACRANVDGKRLKQHAVLWILSGGTNAGVNLYTNP